MPGDTAKHDPAGLLPARGLNALTLPRQARDAKSHAKRCTDTGVAKKPGWRKQAAAFHCEHGNSLMRTQKVDEAIASYRLACKLSPGCAEFLSNLGVALHHRGALAPAIEAYQDAIRLKPDLTGAYTNLGIALQKQGDVGAAIACYRQAIALQPDFAEAHHNLGVALLETGAVADAAAALEAAIALAPRRGAFHRMLASTGRVSIGSAAFRRLQALAQNRDFLDETDRLELHFALGAIYADHGAPKKSFSHLLEANRLQRNRLAYDEAATLTRLERIRDGCTAERLRAGGLHGPDPVQPIFIVGMPRSGTTLVEQVLASHPDVHGAGELPALSEQVAAMRRHGVALPEALVGVSHEALEQLRSAYLAALRARGGAAVRIVDKSLDNFQRIGLIHLALPGARIIHMQRDPLDTCLSCFSKLFTGDHPYSYDLGELGRYYRAYCALMAHWHAALPPGTILDVRHEAVVTDLEGELRRILHYCGLPWNDACMAFHLNPRIVQTASAAQVRQKLDASAVGRWRGFAALAGKLTASLEDRLPTPMT